MLAVLACSTAEAPPSVRYDVGQWIWSPADSSLFVDAARSIDGLTPTVWIGTIGASRDGTVQSRLALSPRVAASPRVAVVIRFEDEFTRAWDQQTDSAVAATVGAKLGSILSIAQTSGVTISEVQLDYDCPERRLARWAAVVGMLSRDALKGRTVWVTSLVAHVRHRYYGDLFRDHVSGHILQVFDTGDRMSVPYARQLERLATRHRLPFRLGVGAFERELTTGVTTNHRAWFRAPRLMAGSRWFRGVWVFPGGRPWASLLERAP